MLPAARRALPLLPLPRPRPRPLPPPAWCWGAARPLGTGRARRSEALAGAPLDTAAKRYSPKVQQLVRDIAGLTLLEVADLNALLKVGGSDRTGSCSVPARFRPRSGRPGPRPRCARCR